MKQALRDKLRRYFILFFNDLDNDSYWDNAQPTLGQVVFGVLVFHIALIVWLFYLIFIKIKIKI